jgi:hypothetical protein
MKKNLIVHSLLLLILFSSNLVISQIPDWTWAKQAGGKETDEGHGIAVDGSGNSYVTGYFTGTASFNGFTLTASGGKGNDIFVAKYDADGVCKWVKQAGGISADAGYGIAVDGSGNSYVTGYFYDAASFNGTSLTSQGNADIFVAKYDGNGTFQWAKQAGGPNWDQGNGIAVDGSGNSYVTGYFNSQASFNGTSLTAAGNNDIFVAKYNSNGDFKWVKQAGGSDSDIGNGIAVDGSGNSYVTGHFRKTASFNGTSLTSVGSSDIFVAKYDDSGEFQGAKKAGGILDDEGKGIAVDGNGNSYVTGYFTGTAYFNGTSLIDVKQNGDIFVAKYNGNGDVQWVRQAGGDYWDQSCGIATDAAGNSYITGSFNDVASFNGTSLTAKGVKIGDIFAAKYDANGTFQWAKQAGGTSDEQGKGIGIDGSGNSYVTGYFSGTASFNGFSLTATGSSKKLGISEDKIVKIGAPDIFVAKLGSGDSDGDGCPDSKEGTGDRDKDGILDHEDYDPTGYFYDEANAKIISGGKIAVTGAGVITIIQDGSSGFYQFFTDGTAGTYTMVVTLPPAYSWSTTCIKQGTLDPTGNPNPLVLGNGENGTTGYLTSNACTKFYLEFQLQPNDPFVFNNNFPLQAPQPTAVTLSAFEATVEENGVAISWSSELEPNIAGYNVYRSKEECCNYEKINEAMILAQGNATEGTSYTFVDQPEERGDYYYKLQEVSLDGTIGFHGPIFLGLTSVPYKKYMIPKEYSLSQNYPNPFNPVTTIEFGLPNPGKVEITIFDVRGRLVRLLISEHRRAGYHWIKWDSRDDYGIKVSSGIYFYHITTNNPAKGGTGFSQTKKMMMLK